MRIVIDMQGAQTESRFRGIGRYTLAFAQALVRNRGEHEIILALSGLFPATIEPIRAAFSDLLPQKNIRVWNAVAPVMEVQPDTDNHRDVAELLREHFLVSLQPDIIHISSLFEGFGDDAVTSIGRLDTGIIVSVTLHDLIPLLNSNHYLKPDPSFERYYLRKINFLKRADIYLAVSESSKQEGILGLSQSKESFVNTLEAVEPCFQPQLITPTAVNKLQQKFKIHRQFILYTGGADERKNLPRLIEAYARLSTSLRAKYQLVFAGKMPEGDIARFKKIAGVMGLKNDELLFTGYISDEELIQLYNLCELYVFPSWHEGFGLPALEAMACGAATIGANTSSLPEVIGNSEALFDPFEVGSISKKMSQVLENKTFQIQLKQCALKQAQKFSWDATAKRAFSAWEALPRKGGTGNIEYLAKSQVYNRLLHTLSRNPLLNAEYFQIAIANCLAQNLSAGTERQLLLDVSELCQRDNATGVQRVVRSYLKCLFQSPPAGFRVEPVYATQQSGYRYARRFILNLLGKSNTEVIDESVRWQRGDVFFGLDMQHHVQLSHANTYQQWRMEGVIVKFLVHDLLPIELENYFKDSDAKKLHEQLLTMIAASDGAICVSKATANSYERWIAENAIRKSPTFELSWVHNGGNIGDLSSSVGFPSDTAKVLHAIRSRITFLCVSTIEPRKGQQQIFDAVTLLWQEGFDINLVFVGKQGWKVDTLADALRNNSENGTRLFWLDGISDEYLEQVYNASTCLIAASINEGFGLSLIEAARHGIPIIARDIPIFREIAGDHAYFFVGDKPIDLVTAIKTWHSLYEIKQHPKSLQLAWSTWQQSTEKLKYALVQENYPCYQLFVDISELVQKDAKTGIQRVVRSILREWLLHPPKGYRIEPVYATTEQGYYYARQFTKHFINSNDHALPDTPIDFSPGDIFFGLDMQPQVQIAQRSFYETLRIQGIHVEFLVHDLLCVETPEYFTQGSSVGFQRWLEMIVENDGAVCVSKTTADSLSTWINQNRPYNNCKFKITYSHNGADIDNSCPTFGIPSDADSIFFKIGLYPSFLLVGTLEPRKGHVQVLDAFENLWSKGHRLNLIIVGKIGWMMENLVIRLKNHPRKNLQLFWLEGISDEYLEKIYTLSTCLIAASYGEGFGLPLIEAAQNELPIIARDIPVFREVAGDNAYYFDTSCSDTLALIIEKWLLLHSRKDYPKSSEIKWISWKESASQLITLLTNGN